MRRRIAPPPAPAPKRIVGSLEYRGIKLSCGEEPFDSGVECSLTFVHGERFTLTRRIWRKEGSREPVPGSYKADAYDEMTKEAKTLIDTRLEVST